MEYLAYRPLRRSTRLAALISISVLQSSCRIWLLIMGSRPYSFPSPFVPRYIKPLLLLYQGRVDSYSIVFIITGSDLLIQKTKIGIAMRATAQDKDRQPHGININKVITVTFAVGSAWALQPV